MQTKNFAIRVIGIKWDEVFNVWIALYADRNNIVQRQEFISLGAAERYLGARH